MSAEKMPDGGTPGDFDHPNEDLRKVIVIALCFAFILSTLAVGLRIWARRINGRSMYLDDYLIIIALLFKYGCSTGVVILLYNGLGSHITMIPKKNLEVYLKIGWSNSFVYTGCVAFIKLSILALYRRLFAIQYMRLGVNIVASFVVLWAVCIALVGAMNCIPVQKFWDPAIEGGCIDSAQFYYGQQVPNIVSDLVILLMPMKSVWDLPISKAQRLMLTGVFILGGLTLVFDIVRLVAMIELTKSGPDITYNQIPVAVWTCIEAAVGIVAACLPNLRPLFKNINYRSWGPLRLPTTQQSAKEFLNPGQSQGLSTLSSDGTVVDPYFGQNTIYTRHSVCISRSKA